MSIPDSTSVIMNTALLSPWSSWNSGFAGCRLLRRFIVDGAAIPVAASAAPRACDSGLHVVLLQGVCNGRKALRPLPPVDSSVQRRMSPDAEAEYQAACLRCPHHTAMAVTGCFSFS